MYIPPLISIICLLSASITLCLGVFVYARNPGKTEHQLFLILSGFAAFWAFFEYMIRQSLVPEVAEFWNFIGSFWILTVPVAMHFVLVFTKSAYAGRDKLAILITAIYLPAIIFLVLDLMENGYHLILIPGYGFDAVPVGNSPWYYIEILFAFLLLLYAEIIGIQGYRATTTHQMRKQYLLIFSGMAVPGLTSIIAILVFPTISSGVSVAAAVGLLGFVVTISYAMLRYGLFIITPTTAAQNIIQIIPDALILTSSDGQIITGNPAAERLLGGEAGLQKRNITEILSHDTVDHIRAMINSRGQVSDLEIVIQYQERKIPVSVSGTYVKDPDGYLAGIIFIIRDITDRKMAEDELKQAQEKIDLLNRITRHDVLNLQTSILGYLYLADELAEEPSLRRYISSCTHLTNRITDYIRFARDYQEIGDHQPRWYPLTESVKNLIDEYNDQNIEIITDIEPITIRADPLFSKVLSNLVDNALRHGESVSCITLTSSLNSDTSQMLQIRDNGCGVPSELKERIFEHGYGKNTGLGLTLCREILNITGITIHETGNPGSGACFDLIIPSTVWKPDNS